MKKILYIILLGLFFSSCMKDPNFNAYVVELTIPLDVEVTLESVLNAKVNLNNLEKGYSIEVFVNSEGKVIFPEVEPGFYSATLSHQFEDALFEYYLNGTNDDLQVFSNVEDTLPVILSTSNSLIIKEFYFNGSLTPANKSYSTDQYIEIYNNSAIVQYVDGISIIEHESYATKANYWDYMPDSIACRMIWTFPGSGADYPINPGQSMVIARDAFDHRDDPLGNPDCPVNLGNADFEFWVETAKGSDIDNPASTNMVENLFTFRGTDVSFHVSGGSAIALARISPDISEIQNVIDNNLVRIPGSTSTRLYGRIANSMVLDAVEVVSDEAHAIYKRFPVVLDAGYIFNESGSKSGKCIRRKVKYVVDGRTVYQDTNNSSVDFDHDVDPKPWIYE